MQKRLCALGAKIFISDLLFSLRENGLPYAMKFDKGVNPT